MKSKLEIQEVKKALEVLKNEYLQKEQELLKDVDKDTRNSIDTPIKDILFVDSFTANGVKYIVRTSLSINRFEQFEKLHMKLKYTVDFSKMFENLNRVFGYLNESRVADATVIVHNIMNGIKTAFDDGSQNEVLQLCSLFICRENENVTVFDEMLCKSKIDDWKIEGIAMESFFTLASKLVNSFTPNLEKSSQNTLEAQPKKTKKRK